MPIRYIPAKKGYQYGTHGKLYLVKDYGKEGAYQKSVNQSKAIHASQSRSIQVKGSNRARGYERRI
jgi:hypothetical protein